MATRRILLPAPYNEWGPLPPHATERRPHRGWRWMERVLILIAVISFGYYGYVSLEARLYQDFENRALDAILASAPAPEPASVASGSSRTASKARPAIGSAIGRIEI